MPEFPCRCGAADIRHTDHAFNIGGDLVVHGEKFCYVVERANLLLEKKS